MLKSKFSLSILILSLALIGLLTACGAAPADTDSVAAQPTLDAPEGTCEGDPSAEAEGLLSDCAEDEGSTISLNLDEKEVPKEAPAALDLPRDVDVATAKEIYQRDDVVFIDVREVAEYETVHIPNTTLIPMSELETRLSEIPTDKTVLISCNSGNRSNRVTQFLTQQGYTNVHNVLGGIQAWQRADYPVNRN